MFKQRGLHFIHLNINSLLPKIDELRLIALETKAAIIGISESKIDDTVLDAEIEIEGYALIISDRNRHGGGIVCTFEIILITTCVQISRKTLKILF